MDNPDHPLIRLSGIAGGMRHTVLDLRVLARAFQTTGNNDVAQALFTHAKNIEQDADAVYMAAGEAINNMVVASDEATHNMTDIALALSQRERA
jgi:hypothetical protein